MYRYIYSNDSKVLHDKGCMYANRIKEEHAKEMSSWFFIRKNGMHFCKCCGYQALLRENADIADEEIDDCAKLLKESVITIEELIKYFRYYKGTMRYKHGVFYLHVYEDQWILDASNSSVTLLHNNYLYNKMSNERHFVGGFHIQELREDTFRCAFSVVEKYRFRCHESEAKQAVVHQALQMDMVFV